MNKKLQGWKSNSLSMAGRIQLINSTLNAIPTHAMQSLSLPASVLKKIDQINNNFLWGHNSNTRKIHHLNWNKVAAPKTFGGLGIRKAKLVNACFMAKLKWNIFTFNRNLSSQTLSLKYGHQLSKNLHLQSYIRRSLNKDNSILNNGLLWKVGNGCSINFWNDYWIPFGPIRNLIQGPLNLNENNTTISDFITSSRILNISTSIPLPDYIHHAIMSTPISLSNLTPNTISWKFSSNGSFSNSSAYNSCFTHHQKSDFVWLWKHPTLPRERLFLWSVCNNAIPTKENLYKKKLLKFTSLSPLPFVY